MTFRRTVLFVHAHPDDETTKGGGLAAWLGAQGVRTVLVTCTDGSAGEVTDDTLLAGHSLADVRRRELRAAATIMGFDQVHEMGFADSGVDAEIADGFANLAVGPMVDDLVAIIDHERPDVVVTYDPEYAANHPDHLRCHDISAAAFAVQCEVENGPRKLYGTRFFSVRRVRAMHQWMADRDLQSPYKKMLDNLPTERFTTRIHIGGHAVTARKALREHRTQIAHDNRWFYSIPDDAYADVYPWEDLELLAVAPGNPLPATTETDLFA